MAARSALGINESGLPDNFECSFTNKLMMLSLMLRTDRCADPVICGCVGCAWLGPDGKAESDVGSRLRPLSSRGTSWLLDDSWPSILGTNGPPLTAAVGAGASGSTRLVIGAIVPSGYGNRAFTLDVPATLLPLGDIVIAADALDGPAAEGNSSRNIAAGGDALSLISLDGVSTK